MNGFGVNLLCLCYILSMLHHNFSMCVCPRRTKHDFSSTTTNSGRANAHYHVHEQYASKHATIMAQVKASCMYPLQACMNGYHHMDVQRSGKKTALPKCPSGEKPASGGIYLATGFLSIHDTVYYHICHVPLISTSLLFCSATPPCILKDT